MTEAWSEEQVRAALGGVDIPACPEILVKLDAELNQDDPDQRRIAKLISGDVALAGRVMQLVNSPALSRGRRVDSIMQGITVLGLGQMFPLVVAELLRRALGSPPGVPMERFWDSAARTALTAAQLARRLGQVRPDQAYTFSLFHDCGIPLLMVRFANYKAVLVAANSQDAQSFCAVEDRLLGTNHAVVGYFLARRWKLPDYLAQAVLHHHDYGVLEESGSLDQASRAVIGINVLAEHLVRHHALLPADEEWGKGASAFGHYFGLAEHDVTDLIDDMLEWLEGQEA